MFINVITIIIIVIGTTEPSESNSDAEPGGKRYRCIKSKCNSRIILGGRRMFYSGQISSSQQ